MATSETKLAILIMVVVLAVEVIYGSIAAADKVERGIPIIVITVASVVDLRMC